MMKTRFSGTHRVVPTRKPRLLFVDDERSILNSMRWLFKRDYAVTLANGGEEAIGLLRQNTYDVIVSDQRMPGITGVEVLKEAQRLSPNGMRILLTGYADLKAVVASVNDGEVFRFVTKPWSNDELRAVIKLAAQTALTAASPEPAAETSAGAPQGSVLVIDEDPQVHQLLGEVLGDKLTVHGANDLDRAMELLEQHSIQVVVSETRIGQTDITGVIKLLKRHHPDVVSIVLTEHGDAETIIDLINQGQVYRFLQKPVKSGQCRLSVQSALVKHAELRQEPSLQARYRVEDVDEGELLARARRKGTSEEQAGLLKSVLGRIGRLFGGGAEAV